MDVSQLAHALLTHQKAKTRFARHPHGPTQKFKMLISKMQRLASRPDQTQPRYSPANLGEAVSLETQPPPPPVVIPGVRAAPPHTSVTEAPATAFC